MAYDLFLFDLDDTLLDFSASERLSFFSTMESLGVTGSVNDLFKLYQAENRQLWKLFEEAKTTKEHLKVERFRRIFSSHRIEIDPEIASTRYLEALPEAVVLVDGAVEICEWLHKRGEIGIVTNGIHHVQTKRIGNSKIAPYISFVSVSEEAGFAKPDVRFFEYSAKMAKKFEKSSSIIIGDRLETDVLGAANFGIDSCWFNPAGHQHTAAAVPKYEIQNLLQLKDIL